MPNTAHATSTVVGVSTDDAALQGAFARKLKLDFPLLADIEGEMARRYGSLVDFRVVRFSRRNTFLIDPQGRIAKHYDTVDPDGHSKVVLDDLKALAAMDNDVPFYVALPSSTFDWSMRDGLREIPIEQRGADEVKYAEGWHNGLLKEVLVAPANSPAANYGFDVTPARLVTGLITERGICDADESALGRLFGG